MARIKLNEPGIRVFLEGPASPVRLDIRRRGEQVKDRAEQIIAETFHIHTGNLLRSVRVIQDPTSSGVRVLCDPDVAPYAGYLEHGTEPHEIRARNKPLLISRAGNPDPLIEPQVSVNHPGNRAYHFMREALSAFNP